MADSLGSVIGHAARAACLSLAAACTAVAQQPLDEVPAVPAFMSRYDFHLTAEGLIPGDDRFAWDTHWGGDFDFVDYVSGRLSFLADYQAVLGHEQQPFDPNQGNYTLAVSSSVRAGPTELAGVFHHVSRHLGDRSKEFGIAYNVLLGRLMRQFAVGTTTVALRAEAGKVTHRAYVDYTWMAASDVWVRRQVSPHVNWFGRVYAETYAVDPEIADRGGRRGGRLEGGVRLSGNRGGLELFAGIERVIDADPLDRRTRHWGFAGFRLLSR
jgi:hypothetical protein